MPDEEFNKSKNKQSKDDLLHRGRLVSIEVARREKEGLPILPLPPIEELEAMHGEQARQEALLPFPPKRMKIRQTYPQNKTKKHES